MDFIDFEKYFTSFVHLSLYWSLRRISYNIKTFEIEVPTGILEKYDK